MDFMLASNHNFGSKTDLSFVFLAPNLNICYILMIVTLVLHHVCVSRRNAFWNGTYFGCIDYLKKEILCPPGLASFSPLSFYVGCLPVLKHIPEFVLKRRLLLVEYHSFLNASFMPI